MGRSCFVPGCKSGYRSTNLKNKAAGEKSPNFFSAPKDPEIFKQWCRAIPRKDKQLSAKDAICEFHFNKDDIQRFDETVLYNGEIFKSERKIPLLKKQAVPNLFPNLPSYFSSHKRKRKPPVERVVNESKMELDLKTPHLVTEEFNFNILCKSLDKVKKTNKWWCINVLENYVAIICWDPKYDITKKIIVDSDLRVKVFLRDQRVTVELKTVYSIENLTSVMQIVDDFKICQNLESRDCSIVPYCGGYVENNSDLCKMCGIVKKNIVIQKKKKASGLNNHKNKDSDLFDEWKKIIFREDKELSKESCVCELHFSEDDIEKFYTTVLPDGTVNKIERGTPTLKKGSIPCILPYSPVLSKNRKRKTLMKQETGKTVKKPNFDLKTYGKKKNDGVGECSVQKKLAIEQQAAEAVKSKCQSTISIKKNVEGSRSLVTQSELEKNVLSESKQSNYQRQVVNTPGIFPAFQEFSFKFLLENVNLIKMPTKWWSLTSTPQYLVCAKWSTDYVTERKVVITQDLSIKVYFRDWQFEVPSKEIKSVNDISVFLESVNTFALCTGIQQVLERKCLVLLPDRSDSRGRYTSLCEECRTIRRNQLQTERRESYRNHTIAARKTQLSQSLKCEKRKNFRLQGKVTRLKEQIAMLKTKCKTTKSEQQSVPKAISSLHDSQQDSDPAFIQTAKMHSTKDKVPIHSTKTSLGPPKLLIGYLQPKRKNGHTSKPGEHIIKQNRRGNFYYSCINKSEIEMNKS